MASILNVEWDFLLPKLTLPGVVNCSDTTAVVGNFWAIQVLADSQFTTLSEMGSTGSLTGVVKAGNFLFGRFLGFQLSSGSVRAYRY